MLRKGRKGLFFVFLMCVVSVVGLARADIQRLSFEHRDGCQLDNQVARGNAQVVASPLFAEGIRLACWAYSEQIALASAIYYFDIPAEAQSVKVRIPYIAEEQASGNGGSVWIKRAGGGAGKEEEAAQLYGDTFILKDDVYLEAINVSVTEYRQDDGRLELHLVAEGSQCIDVRYIEIETYAYPTSERVVRREYYFPPSTERVVERYYYSPPTTTVYLDWPWWYPYRTYWYYYRGPVYHWEWLDGYWVRVYYSYPYPRYEYYRPLVRVYWDNYWHRHPSHRVQWLDVYRGGHHHRPALAAWDNDCEQTRRTYRAAVNCGDPARVKERVRSVLVNHKQRRESRSTQLASVDRVSTDRTNRTDRTWSEVASRGEASPPATPQKTRREETRVTRSSELSVPGREVRESSGGFEKTRQTETRTEIRSVRSAGSFDRVQEEISRSVQQRTAMEKTRRDVERVSVRPSHQSEARSAPGREVRENRSAPSPAPKVKQRPEPVRTSPQPQVIERREVRTEPRPTPQVRVKERRVVERSVEQRSAERSVSPAPARSSSDNDDDEKEKRQSASSSGSSAAKRRR